MSSFLVTAAFAVGLFVACFLAMAIGLLIRGTVMRGGCGSRVEAPDGERCGNCGTPKAGSCSREKEAPSA